MGAVCLEGRDSGGVTRVGTRLFDQEPGVGEGLARHGPDALAGPAHRDRHDPPAAAGGIWEGCEGTWTRGDVGVGGTRGAGGRGCVAPHAGWEGVACVWGKGERAGAHPPAGRGTSPGGAGHVPGWAGHVPARHVTSCQAFALPHPRPAAPPRRGTSPGGVGGRPPAGAGSGDVRRGRGGWNGE